MEATRFEQFLESAKKETYQADMKGSGTFEYDDQIIRLMVFSDKVNMRLLAYLFGTELGEHLAIKYMEARRNLLVFLGLLDSEKRFFILHEIKTNSELYAHC